MTDRRRRYSTDRVIESQSNERDPPQTTTQNYGVESVRRDGIDRAERTLNVQRERFDRIDEKSSKLLRFVAALSGAIFALLGLGSGSSETLLGRDITTLLASTKLALVVGSVSLLATVFLAAATYVTTRFRSSFRASTTDLIKDRRFEPEAYEKLVLKTYAEAIRENRPIIRWNQRLFAYTLRSLVIGITAISTATITSLLKPVGRIRGAVIGATTVLLIIFLAYVATGPSVEP